MWLGVYIARTLQYVFMLLQGYCLQVSYYTVTTISRLSLETQCTIQKTEKRVFKGSRNGSSDGGRVKRTDTVAPTAKTAVTVQTIAGQ